MITRNPRLKIPAGSFAGQSDATPARQKITLFFFTKILEQIQSGLERRCIGTYCTLFRLLLKHISFGNNGCYIIKCRALICGSRSHFDTCKSRGSCSETQRSCSSFCVESFAVNERPSTPACQIVCRRRAPPPLFVSPQRLVPCTRASYCYSLTKIPIWPPEEFGNIFTVATSEQRTSLFSLPLKLSGCQCK